jgi:hypothetical protein
VKKVEWPRVLHLLATAVVIGAAALMWHALPTPDDVYGPFDVDAGMGQQAEGRAITAQVTGARIAPRIRKPYPSAPVVDAVGVWVAIDGEAMTTRTDEVPNVELIIGRNSYVPTERLDFMPLTGRLSPGIAVRSSWVFDVPAELVAPGAQHLTLHVWVGDGRLDSRLVVDVPLTDSRVTRSDLIRLEPTVEVGT